MPVFADDSDLNAKRETALRALLDALPLAYRIPMRAQFTAMVNAMTGEQLVQVVSDIREGKEAAATGDIERLMNVARHWATDEQIREYLPMAERMLHAG